MKEYKRETGQEELQKLLNDEVNQILRANLYEVGLSEKELKRLRIRKRELRDALNQCGIGDLAAKEYVKNVLEDILVKKYKYGEKEWNSIIPFENRMHSTCLLRKIISWTGYRQSIQDMSYRKKCWMISFLSGHGFCPQMIRKR